MELVEDRANRAWHVLHRRAAGQRVQGRLRARCHGQAHPRPAAQRSRRRRSDLVAADPDHHGGGRQRAGDALRHHRRPRPGRGVAGARQHRLRRAVRGAGDRHGRDRPAARPPPAAPCSSCCGPSGSRRPAARTAICAWCVDERTAAFPWELLDDRRPWLEAGRRRRRQSAQARGGPRRPDPPARADPVPREGRGTRRPPAGAGRGRSARRAAARLPAAARSRGRGRRRRRAAVARQATRSPISPATR